VSSQVVRPRPLSLTTRDDNTVRETVHRLTHTINCTMRALSHANQTRALLQLHAHIGDELDRRDTSTDS